MDKSEKLKEYSIIVFFIVLFVALFVGKLFPVNYPTDIYNIKILGLKEYAFKWFLPSGRLIGIIVLNAFDAFNISIDGYIAIMKTVSIFLASISVFLFYDLITKKKSVNTIIEKGIILLLSLVLFLNHGTYQYFYYPESGIMWLAVLNVVLALRCMVLNKKNKYIKSFLYIFLALNCYQAIVFLYLPALILFMGTYLDSTKKEWKELIKNTFIVLANIVLGYIIVYLARKYFDVITFKPIQLIINIKELAIIIYKLLFVFYDSIPNSLILLGNIIIFEILLLLRKNTLLVDKKIIMARCFLIFLVAFAELFCTVGFLDFYNGDRIQFAYIVTVILNMIAIVLYSNIFAKKKTSYIVFAFLIFLLIINILNSYDLTQNSIWARNMDIEYGNIISQRVHEYEQENNVKIKKIVYCSCDSYTPYELSIRGTYEISAKAISYWSTETALQYYLGEDIEIIEDEKAYVEIFDEENWYFYDEEQIKFYGDTMYICFY